MPSLLNQDLSIASLPIPEDIQDILRKMGINSLYPSQARCVKPLFEGKSLVLAVPTASGKTLVAYLAILNKVIFGGGKALYIVPLRSLAFEKYEELKKIVPPHIKVGMTVGDYTASDDYARNYDILVATSEKVDSLLRSRSLYYNDINCFVADEIHLLDDPGRGATLEVILTKVRMKNPNAQIIGLSATIPNAADIASWLGAELIFSTWRPVELKKGVLSGRDIHFEDGSQKTLEDHIGGKKSPLASSKRSASGDEILNVVLDTVKNKKQILIFQNTRRTTETFSRKLGLQLKESLSQEEAEKLDEMARELQGSQLDPIPLVEELAATIRTGAAYHHAGLTNSQRKLIEQGFSKGFIKALCATPTLAAGVNLPAQRVVVKDIYRFGQFGMQPISPLEIQQMLGRAGRPQFDSYGEAMVVAPAQKRPEQVVEEVLKREPADIVSKLFLESNLRKHILGFIAEGTAGSRKELEEVLSRTFLAYQGGDYRDNLAKVLCFLEKNEFIRCLREESQEEETGREESERSGPGSDPGELLGFTQASALKRRKKREDVDYPINASELGHRTARLYIDPHSAVEFRKALLHLKEKKAVSPDIENSEIFYFQAMCRATEVYPFFLRRGELADLMAISKERRPQLLLTERLEEDRDQGEDQNKRKPRGRGAQDTDLEWYFAQLKTALFFEDWVKETKEKILAKKYRVGPGDIRTRVEVATWLLGAFYELARMQDVGLDVSCLRNLVVRIEFGIRAELLPLVKVKGVGRVRARTLFDAGYTTKRRLTLATEAELAKLPGFGPKLAASLKQNLEGKQDEDGG